MKRLRFLAFSPIFISLLIPAVLFAQDLNDMAYDNRVHLEAGTIWNPGGNGDCLLFPYYDVRKVGGKTQVANINIENSGEYGIAAKLRFRDWARGREVFSKDIWIPTKAVWSAKLEMSGDGTNTIISGTGNVITRNDANTFYFTSSLAGGASFSTNNIRKGLGESTLFGFVEVIGEERTAPDDKGGQTGRLSSLEQDCPNDLKGSLSITRVEDGATMAYDAVAIGNFSRGQGSLFRSPGSPYPRLDTCEDSLDQIEFQISKFEVFGPFSVTPSNQGKTSLIVTFPTKFFHYSSGRRVKKINNPFEARTEGHGETLKTSLSKDGALLPADSELTLPYSVNVIGLYQGSGSPPSGIDNLSLPVFSYDSGEVKLTSENMAQRILIQDYEYFREMFTTYRGLPALGLVLREYRKPDVLHPSISPAEFSAVWEASAIESILFPTFIIGPSFGVPATEYTYTTGGAVSSIGDPIQYQFDWGDGTAVDDTTWLDAGVTSAKHTYAAGGVYAIYSRARCAYHTSRVSKWSKGFVVVIESVSTPSILAGPVTGLPNVSYTYTTGGSATSTGNPVQYFFSWGDNTDSNWLPVGVTTASKAWATGGNYNVTAKARSSVNPLIESAATSPLVVRIEKITAPQTPVGPTQGLPKGHPNQTLPDTLTFTTGGASSNTGDPIEYRYDWGDGTFSAWSSTPSASKSWDVGADYQVRVQARCAVHTSIVSAWSTALKVSIEFISKPAKPSGPVIGIPFTGYSYTATGATSNVGDPVEYLFDWGDGTTSVVWIKPNAQGTATAIHAWQLGGTFNVTVFARCASHPDIISVQSDILAVDIEVITPPGAPTSPDLLNFLASGATSNLNDPLEYQFNWGDGTLSTWITPVGDTATAQHHWASAGTYSVSARARCKTHTGAVSDWSPPLSVTIP